MSKFTSTKAINSRWRNNDFVGAAGSTHTFPDQFHDEFLVDWALQISDGSIVITETPTTGNIQMAALTVGNITLTGTASGFPGSSTILGTSPINVVTASGTSTISVSSGTTSATVATGNHAHAAYVATAGDTVTGNLIISNTGTLAIFGATSTANTQVTTRVDGDTATRWGVRADGFQAWGDGITSRDTNLYRSAANTLATDDNFDVGQTLTVGGDIINPTQLDFNAGGSVTASINSAGLYLSAGKGVTFEGTTDDAFETRIIAGDPTADRTITLPDATGTVSLTSHTHTDISAAGWEAFTFGTAGVIATVPRFMLTSSTSPASGTILHSRIIPHRDFTVTNIAFAGTNAASVPTLIRFGIYTRSGTTFTLVARTASDTTIFDAANTKYTRALNTTGGYPATYTLTAGTEYFISVIQVATTPATLLLATARTSTVANAATGVALYNDASETDLVTPSTGGAATTFGGLYAEVS